MKKRITMKNIIGLLFTFILIIPFFMISCDEDDETKKNDIAELQALVVQAENSVADASEGNSPGDYVLGSIDDLQDGIDQAEQVLNNSSATQTDIDEAVTQLEDVIYAFEANEIEDVAIKFGQTDSSIAVENSANSSEIFDLSEFTFETWVIYSDKPGFFGQIVSTEFYEDGLRGWNLRIGDNDALDFTIADGNESRLQPETGATVPRNTWTHVACTFDGTMMKSYINGELVGEVDASDRDSIYMTSTLAGKQQLTFGNSAGFQQPERRLIGKLFDVRFWDVARTQAEIQSDKDYILTGNEEHMVAYWPFRESNPNLTIVDETGNYNLELKNGTILGTRN